MKTYIHNVTYTFIYRYTDIHNIIYIYIYINATDYGRLVMSCHVMSMPGWAARERSIITISTHNYNTRLYTILKHEQLQRTSLLLILFHTQSVSKQLETALSG